MSPTAAGSPLRAHASLANVPLGYRPALQNVLFALHITRIDVWVGPHYGHCGPCDIARFIAC